MEGGGGGGRWMDALCVRSPCHGKRYWCTLWHESVSHTVPGAIHLGCILHTERVFLRLYDRAPAVGFCVPTNGLFHFPFSFQIPVTFPDTAPERAIPELDGKMAKMFRCTTCVCPIHFLTILPCV